MIWIATLCLLAVIAWLFVNALNERRWVQAHSHDEGVAADKGIIPDFSAMTARMNGHGEGRVALDDEDTLFARAVKRVQSKGAKLGERIERRAAAGRERDDRESFFGRAVERIGGAATRLDDRLDARARRKASAERRSATEEDTFFGRATARVARKQEEYGQRMRERVQRKAGTATGGATAGAGTGGAAATTQGGGGQPRKSYADEGFFGRMVDRVSGRMERIERPLEDRASKARGASGDDREDFVTRTSAKVGGRINEIDEKIVDASKSAADRIDRKTDF